MSRRARRNAGGVLFRVKNGRCKVRVQIHRQRAQLRQMLEDGVMVRRQRGSFLLQRFGVRAELIDGRELHDCTE